jgi:hypothetical protein
MNRKAEQAANLFARLVELINTEAAIGMSTKSKSKAKVPSWL